MMIRIGLKKDQQVKLINMNKITENENAEIVKAFTMALAKESFAEGFRKGFLALMEARAAGKGPKECAEHLHQEMLKGMENLDKLAEEAEGFTNLMEHAAKKKGTNEKSN